LALIQFSDGVQALQFSGDTPSLAAVYRAGMATTNNGFTGLVPLANGQFVLLDAAAGSIASTHAQVVKFDGTNFTQIGVSGLPPTTSRSTRANVWLFQNEPFVNSNPSFIASFSSPDWSDGIINLLGTIAVTTETDAGAGAGLNSAVTNNLGATPPGANYAVANQYRDVISVFSYAAPRAAEPVVVTISPSPGIFSGPIQISFSTLSAGDKVFYRAGSTDGWHLYATAFSLTNSSAVQFYGTNVAGARSQLLTANYSIASTVPPIAAYNLTNGAVSTNSSPSTTFTPVLLSSDGTIFYGRENSTGGSIWAINLDGSGETYITTGARPRASRDGRYVAFSRGTNIFRLGGNEIWVRDLQTAAEWELFTNQSQIVGYDWDLANPPNLILDSGCNFMKVPLSNSASVFQVSHDCNDNAPVLNPLDGRVAFQNPNPQNTFYTPGIFVGPASGGAPQQLTSAGPFARWPAWSPDGGHLSYAFLNNPYAPLGESDIYTINADGTSASQITAFTNISDGFKFGTVWSPAGNALVGAGTINGTNGLWVVPLTADGQHCDCPAILLPTAAGDPIDFAGSVVVAPELAVAKPGLFIRMEPNAAVVYWSTNYQGFGLEYTANLGPNATWTAVSGPYFLNGGNFEYHEAKGALLVTKFFRLKYPTIIFLNPLEPQLSFSFQAPAQQAILTWSKNYTGYTLESTTNLAAPVVWLPVMDGSGTLTNGHVEFRQNLDHQIPRQFFRLRWP
jgi:Tol biopolymer transport system component